MTARTTAKAATKAAAQPVEPDPAEDGREAGLFGFEGREVALFKPSSGQEYILLTLLNLGDESASAAEKVRTVRTFGTMLQSLFVDATDLDFVLGWLARGGEIEPFVDLARQMAEHWTITDEPENRTERRTRERRPAKAVKATGRRR